MKRRGLIVLLLSGCVLVCHVQTDDIIRSFQAVKQEMSWTAAQQYCRATFTDLATIQDPARNVEAKQVAGKGQFWIGLFNTSWRWSLGNEDGTTFTRWAPTEPSHGYCVTISILGFWYVRDCTVKYGFVCYNAATNSHILVTTAMTMADAQTYCRWKYTDLSTISTIENNTQITSLLHPVTSQITVEEAWIGLYRYFWGWSDRSDATYRLWGKKQSNGENCVMMDSSSSSAYWYRRSCDEKHSVLCYTTVSTSALKTVKVQLSAGSADLNDPAVQDSILQQLHQKLQDGGVMEEMTLRWWSRPDGKVFHTEEERAPSCAQNKEDTCSLVWTTD